MLSSCGKDDFLNFTIKIVEASLFLMRRRTAETGLPVTQHIFIFDLKNFSLAAATHTATIDLLRKLITIYEGGERGGLQSYFLVFLNEIYFYKKAQPFLPNLLQYYFRKSKVF